MSADETRIKRCHCGTLKSPKRSSGAPVRCTEFLDMGFWRRCTRRRCRLNFKVARCWWNLNVLPIPKNPRFIRVNPRPEKTRTTKQRRRRLFLIEIKKLPRPQIHKVPRSGAADEIEYPSVAREAEEAGITGGSSSRTTRLRSGRNKTHCPEYSPQKCEDESMLGMKHPGSRGIVIRSEPIGKLPASA